MFNSCDGCFDNPCSCGKGYMHLSSSKIKDQITVLKNVLKTVKVNEKNEERTKAINLKKSTDYAPCEITLPSLKVPRKPFSNGEKELLAKCVSGYWTGKYETFYKKNTTVNPGISEDFILKHFLDNFDKSSFKIPQDDLVEVNIPDNLEATARTFITWTDEKFAQIQVFPK